MFIKKDYRKIDEILDDPQDQRESLKLSKRGGEFNGKITCLCREAKLNSFANLKFLNLYGNDLTDITGVGFLSNTPVEEINLGGNSLKALPVEVDITHPAQLFYSLSFFF